MSKITMNTWTDLPSGSVTSRTEDSDSIEIRLRSWVSSSGYYAKLTQTEPTSSKQKERDVVYKYSNPLESHRNTGDKHDPVFYELNDQWFKQTNAKGCMYYAWNLQGEVWEMVDYELYLQIKTPPENEWGPVSP